MKTIFINLIINTYGEIVKQLNIVFLILPYPESDFYISISDMLNVKNNTNIKVIPYIVDLPICDENLRDELKIPQNSIVYGRYGGLQEFNIGIAHGVIKDYLKLDNTCYFLFMNTDKFYEHPRIIRQNL